MMNPFSIRRAQASFLRVAINAENVAQYILSRGSRPLLVPASAARRLQLESADASTTHRRRHHTRRSHEKPSIQLAFNPSFRLDALANFSSALGASSRQRQSPLIRALGARHASTDAEVATSPEDEPIVPSTQSLTNGLTDEPMILDEGEKQVDWAHSFHGLSREPFAKEAAEILMKPLPFHDVEIKPDGIIYLPEIKYRRILNQAFGPGGWGLAPRGETIVTGKAVTREYALVAHGRLVSVARGEQDYFSADGIATATEGCKSNAMMRCCKDLGVASELWDPRFIRKFMSSHAKEVWVEHVVSKKKKKIWIRKDDEVRYPYKESKYGG